MGKKLRPDVYRKILAGELAVIDDKGGIIDNDKISHERTRGYQPYYQYSARMNTYYFKRFLELKILTNSEFGLLSLLMAESKKTCAISFDNWEHVGVSVLTHTRSKFRRLGLIDKLTLTNRAKWYLNPDLCIKAKSVKVELGNHFKDKLQNSILDAETAIVNKEDKKSMTV